MKVPLLDLGPQTEMLREEIIVAVTKVIDSTRYILGPEVDSFEKKIADYCGSGFAVGVSSGTDALVISLMAMGIGAGDRVVTSPYSFFATMGAILRVGAKPVFVDIDEKSFNLSPSALASTLHHEIDKKEPIKAILPVHLFGQCADMGAILELARQYDIPVIEDAAQAIGACCPMLADDDIEWKKAGSMGLGGCFSFFPSKNLGGIGDGGLVSTCDDEFIKLLRSFRNHGANPKYYHAQVGGNFRLDPVQAVVLAIKLRHLEKWHSQRRENSELYRKLFASHDLLDSAVVLPVEMYSEVNGADTHTHHIYNQFVIRAARRRDQLKLFLASHSIGCEVYYPVCLHKQKCVRQYNGLEFPVAEKAAEETLALPVYPELSEEQQVYVVEKIAEFYSSC